MFLNIVKADGTAEQAVIREMKARAAGARGDIEQIVRGVMADVQQRGWDAVVEYAERFDGKAPYIVEPKVLDDAYNACDPKLIAALEKAAADGEALTDDCAAVERLGMRVSLTPGSRENFKITTPFDLLVGEAVLEARARGEL